MIKPRNLTESFWRLGGGWVCKPILVISFKLKLNNSFTKISILNFIWTEKTFWSKNRLLTLIDLIQNLTHAEHFDLGFVLTYNLRYSEVTDIYS